MIENAKRGLVKKVKSAVFKPDETLPLIMDKLVPRYKGRIGGYTRILRDGYRSSGTDRAPLAIVEFVDSPKDTMYHLAHVQLPSFRNSLKRLQSEKYSTNPVQLFDPVTGEPSNITQFILKRGLDSKRLIELNKKEKRLERIIQKYERALITYPKARENDGIPIPKIHTVDLTESISELSLESKSHKSKQVLVDAEKEESKKGWFKWF